MTLLTPQQLHDYQKECILHMLYHNDSMLWVGLGLGKTPITLTTIVDRMKAGQVKKTLVVGPLRVIQAVWHREARKWSHTEHLRFSTMHGTEQQRERALFADADIYLVNYENMNWLAQLLLHYYISQDKPLPFEMVVYDEVSKLKNSTSKRMAGGKRDRKDKWGATHEVKLVGWRKIIPHFKYRTGLTGTPASNGYMDLHGQYLAVDNGERLGPFVTHFRDSYFASDYMGWTYKPTELGKQFIEEKISDITKKMDAKDYLDLPDCKVTNIMVDLPPKARKAYEEVEADMFTQLDNGSEIEVFSRSSVSNKSLQFCLAEGTEVLTSGGWKNIEAFTTGETVWDGEEWVSVHSLAFQGVKEVVELDGVWMTPDHRVLTNSGWAEAQDIIHDNASGRFDRANVRLPDGYLQSGIDTNETETGNVAGAMHLRERIQGDRTEPTELTSTGDKILRVSSRRNHIECDRVTWYDENETIRDLDKHEIEMQESRGQGLPKLRRERYFSLRSLVRFLRGFLGGYGVGLPITPTNRTVRQRRELQQTKLPMGNTEPTIEQPKEQSLYQHTIREDDRNTSSSSIRIQGCDTVRQNTQRVAGGASVTTSKVAKTYDLINTGERNRFTVRGNTGEVFIVHNCNGSPYLSPESSDYEVLHDAKLDALEDILEEAAGTPVLCSYTFKADADRIMKRFKSYKPVNLTETPANQTEQVINDWNSGKLRLIVGHPACLHPDTQVLTERRGWVRIVDVTKEDRMFDGIEYVSHDGCMYAGYKEVIDVFGITMTPDHKLWINEEWVEGQHVDVSDEGRRQAEFKWENEDAGSGQMRPLRPGADDTSPEHGQTQQKQNDPLSTVQVPSHDRDSDLENMVGTEASSDRPKRQRLRRSRNRNMRRVGELREILRGHVGDLFRRAHHRTDQCERPILQSELHMGDCIRAAGEQAQQPICGVSGRADASGGVVPAVRLQQNGANHEIESGHDCRRSGPGCTGIEVRKESGPEEQVTEGKAHVYDLVNCGPRHRFLVRNADGQMFIAKNSMGHGIDGLQESGNILVWFGLNWSLELYEQMNGRINRQGQKRPVSILRILCNDTVDLAVADALERKTDDQEGLKSALQRYRDGHTDNNLTVNFW